MSTWFKKKKQRISKLENCVQETFETDISTDLLSKKESTYSQCSGGPSGCWDAHRSSWCLALCSVVADKRTPRLCQIHGFLRNSNRKKFEEPTHFPFFQIFPETFQNKTNSNNGTILRNIHKIKQIPIEKGTQIFGCLWVFIVWFKTCGPKTVFLLEGLEGLIGGLTSSRVRYLGVAIWIGHGQKRSAPIKKTKKN